MNSPQRIGHWWRWWMIGYVVLMCAVVGTMFWLRQSAVPDWSSPKSVSDWQAWQKDVRDQQTKRVTVERRVPKSDEPPALVLLRDFFAVIMVGSVLFTSLLYWIIAWFITGIFSASHQND